MADDFFDELVCPHCRKLTSFEPTGQLMVHEFTRWSNGAPVDVEVKARRYSCLNPNCRAPILVQERNHRIVALMYPSVPGARSLDSTVPADVAEAFAEGSQCQAIGAMRAAGAMYRMALELVCDQQKIPRSGKNPSGQSYGSLANRVPDLEAKGLPQSLVDNMHQVRLVGNDSVHEGIAFSTDELDDIASMIEEAVEVLWVQPAKRASMEAARQARRAAAKAASAASSPASP